MPDPGMAGQNGTAADGTGIRRYDGPSAGRAAGAAGKIAEGKAPGGAVRLSSAAVALWEQRGWRDLPRIEVDELGKPFFPDHPDTHFSLSHTAGAAAAALADTPVGVDIERVRTVSVRAMERIAGVRTEAAFFRSWVRREARVKRTGSGIVTMMRTEAAAEPGGVLLRGGCLSWLRGGCCCRTAGAAAAGAPSDAGPTPLTA